MLCQFTVKNYKSIRDEVTFDMQAAAISEHEDRIIKDQDGELLHCLISYINGWTVCQNDSCFFLQCAQFVVQRVVLHVGHNLPVLLIIRPSL